MTAAVSLPPHIARIMRKVQADDRVWFRQHPGRRWRVRRAIPHEAGPEEIATDTLLVVDLCAGVHARIPIAAHEDADRLARALLRVWDRILSEEERAPP